MGVRRRLIQRAGQAHDGEHQENGEQKQRDRRDEVRALAVDVAARQLARPPREQRQGAPDLSLEVQHTVQQIVKEAFERAVDVGLLPALVAIRPRSAQRRN